MYLTGKYVAETDKGRVSEFCGVFSTKEKAIAACKGEMYFYAPVTIDKEAPDDIVDFPEAIFPFSMTEEHDDESS